ncbi:phospholipase D3-like [Coturnix japonica]|uniref:phospholipase D3-like n=1 Tax=Coturnix japonica TaxID=93934 RepID=UPI0013A5CB26|nr:phospholipase D3-like [Coturnix japonica]
MPCSAVLVVSTPSGLHHSSFPSTFSCWLHLLRSARRSVDVASFYWTMSNNDTNTTEQTAAPVNSGVLWGQWEQWGQWGQWDSMGAMGPMGAMGLMGAMGAMGVMGVPMLGYGGPRGGLWGTLCCVMGGPIADLWGLCPTGAAVRMVDVGRLAGGVLHTKLWVVDGAHVYLGSANMDWRSLTQVKELGVALYNCSIAAQDVAKVFEAYWALGAPNASIPRPWPGNFSTSFNMETPLRLRLNGTPTALYFSSSPPSFCAAGRTPDLQAVLGVINSARSFIDVAVMSYLPASEFQRHNRFWPPIDDALRRAVFERGVRLKLLLGCWAHSKAAMFPFIKSLAAISDNRTGYSAQVVSVSCQIVSHRGNKGGCQIVSHRETWGWAAK